MTIRNTARHLVPVCFAGLIVAGLSLPIQAQDQGMFSGLPYAESFIQEKLVQHTVKSSAAEAAWEIPVNLFYRLVFEEILTDKNLQARIAAVDIESIKNLPAPVDHRFLVKDQEEITAICIASNDTDTPAEIMDLATRYDNSRKRKDDDLDAFYDASLTRLTEDTRKYIHDRVLDYTSKNLTYTTLDMAGFARDVPEAAKVMLLSACENFSAQIISYTPQTVKLSDLYL